MTEPLPSSTTHRLCYLTAAKTYQVIQHAAADEIEELRAFIEFLFPPKGQDRFELERPDMLDLRWTVFDRQARSTYAAGSTPLEAVRNARLRLENEKLSPSVPFTLAA